VLIFAHHTFSKQTDINSFVLLFFLSRMLDMSNVLVTRTCSRVASCIVFSVPEAQETQILCCRHYTVFLKHTLVFLAYSTKRRLRVLNQVIGFDSALFCAPSSTSREINAENISHMTVAMKQYTILLEVAIFLQKTNCWWKAQCCSAAGVAPC
jgi:hypothetical protein